LGAGALQGNFGTGVQLKLRKHPNAYSYEMKPEFTCYKLFNNLDAIG
jgi:hypothetical protein